MAGKDMTLTLPGGAPMAARTTGATGKGGPGLFNGSYYWQVPATTRLATLRLSLPPLVASGSGSARARGRLRTTASPVQLVFFPSPYQGPGTGGGPAPPSTLAPTPAGQTASDRQACDRGGPVAPGNADRAGPRSPWRLLLAVVARLPARLGSARPSGRQGQPSWRVHSAKHRRCSRAAVTRRRRGSRSCTGWPRRHLSASAFGPRLPCPRPRASPRSPERGDWARP
jgi:hypothetical protein